MTTFRECIQTAIDTGRVTKKKGAEAHKVYDRRYQKAIAAGEPEGAADLTAASAALEEITSLKAEKRWQRINEMQRANEIYTRLMGAKDPEKELQAIVVDLELSQETVRSFAMANLDRLMLKFKPKLAGVITPTEGMDDIVHAAYGTVRSQEAKELADAIVETRELLRKWANRYGVKIQENTNAKLPQTHDSVKVAAVSEDEWVADHIRTLDWEVMKFGGKSIDPDEREDILRRTYQGIINDGFDREDLAQLHKPGLANRLNRDRFLYYGNADGYLEMQKKYGAGNFYEQTINMVEIMAKDISLLRTFGPSSDSMREFTKRVALKRAADLNTNPKKKNLVKSMEKQVALFDREYEIHSWHVTSADGNLPVQAFSTVRTMAVNALLGMSFIPNLFGDLANAASMKRVLNMPEVSVLRAYAANWVPTKENLAEAAQLGIIFENAISLTQARLRYFGALDGPHLARRIGDFTYRFGLAAHHTQVARNAQGKQLMGVWANWSGKKFDDLPFAPFLVERGITAADWDAFRVAGKKRVGNADFLVPREMFNAGDDAAKAVSQKFSDAMQLYIRTMVPDVNLRSRAAMGEAIDPNTVAGQSLRTMTTLISFPVGIWFNQLSRIAALPGLRNKIRFGAAYAAWMTLAGAAITQTRALANGQNPFDMTFTDENGHLNDFWMRAAINGGSFGIVGDLIFNNINVSNSRHFRGGPTEEYLTKLHALTLDNAIDFGQTLLYNEGLVAEPGDDLNLGADAMKFADANVPDFWQFKLLFERAYKDRLMEMADPKGWQRKQEYMQEHSEGMYWEPGQAPTAPDLTTAVNVE